MKLTFLGANHCVTGSRYCLEVGDIRVMIDCGMVQERQHAGRNWESSPIRANSIKALLLTHIHIDHSGLIPKFVREGFDGPIIATRPTVDLADIVLRDSARIQEEDAAYKKKTTSARRPPKQTDRRTALHDVGCRAGVAAVPGRGLWSNHSGGRWYRRNIRRLCSSQCLAGDPHPRQLPTTHQRPVTTGGLRQRRSDPAGRSHRPLPKSQLRAKEDRNRPAHKS